MSPPIPPDLLRAVCRRAQDRCEYCLLAQQTQEATFHVDHIAPRKLGGTTSFDNLALACVTCSLRKAARTHALDPRTETSVPLFHPRRDHWEDHFRWTVRWRMIGKTPTGRATILALAMNAPRILRIRRVFAALGAFP